jgi:hypothetical protein
MQAPHNVRSGDVEHLTLLKYPPPELHLHNADRAIIKAWEEWWKSTSWAGNEASQHPRWGSSARTGDVWTKFYEAAAVVDGHPYVFCIQCGRVLQHPAVKNIGTKHLQNHLKSNVCRDTKVSVHGALLAPLHPPRQTQDPIPYYSPEAFAAELVRVLVDNNWPFRTIERPSFQRFVHFLRSNAPATTRYRFRQMFDDQLQHARAAILHDIGTKTRLSIALDAWSAANHLSFLAINGYYINDQWELKEVLLDFLPLRGSHTGYSMAHEVVHVLKDLSATRRLLAVTCDNASNNGTLAKGIGERLLRDDIDWSPKENTIPCLAHVVNLVVQDIITHLKLADYMELPDGSTLQRQHTNQIRSAISVPNSLKKLSGLSHTFITY